MRQAAIKQARDIGMRQPRQDLPFVQKAVEYCLTVHAALYQLEGDELFELSVIALCQHHNAHAAAPQLASHAPASNLYPSGRRLTVARPIRRHGDTQSWNVLFQCAAGRVGLQQLHDLTA